MDDRKQTSDAVVLVGHGDTTKILLIRRKYSPYQHEFAFPGGFLNKNEDPLVGCLRELHEETGLVLEGEDAVQLSIRQKEGRDPRGMTVTYPYLFWLNSIRPIKSGDDAEKAEWIQLKKLDHLAFDHGAILLEALGKFWPEFPPFDRKIENALPIYGQKSISTEDIILYAGSFNPWHEGHQSCVESILKKNKLIVVPDTNPFKFDKKINSNQCFFKRYQELLSKKELRDIPIYPGFFGMERPHPTVSWLPFLKIKHKSLLMGEDGLIELKLWTNVDVLLKSLTKIYLVPRSGQPEQVVKAKNWLSQAAPAVQLVELPHHPYEHVTSTELRKRN